ncbi:MAG TPA: 1,4-dihydroxy-2-naphthoate polyprenyltransferase [Actinomycetota bacterium]|nr:1,4-dihydroxy-2-naphthoate polyprenyltransferase [Actinomycetota bacterium]
MGKPGVGKPGMVGLFWEAARPKTLGAGVVCVLVGTAAAGSFIAWRFAAAMVASVAVQVAVNYANDYFDAVKGIDTVHRTGPRRVTSAGLVTPGQMRLATGVALGVASVPGLALAAALGPQVIVVGLFCFAAALGYSGGPRPFASLGLGEVFVFVFFGIVGTVGAAYVQTGRLTALAFAVAVPVGALASALLLANNIRDIDTDAAAGKRTMAVRIGREPARAVFGGLFAVAFAGTAAIALGFRRAGPLVALVALPLALVPLRLVRSRSDGPGLIKALLGTARLQLVFGVLLALGLWWSWT